MILALTVHEYSHALVAAWLGDDTAERMGRKTLNPISHIDPIGTLLIPMVGIASGVPFFGWAKPVPVSPVQFTRRLRMKTGMLLTAVAGPASNLLFALVMAILLGFIGPSAIADIAAGVTNAHVAIVRLAGWTLVINVGLFVFNLLPIPPLDGSKVLAGLLPDRYMYILEFLSKYSFMLFIGLLLLGGRFIGTPIFWILHGLSQLVGFEIGWALWGA
jgi:Zn-dependent protease